MGSGQQKIGKKDCKAAGGVNGDRSNQMANSPICLPPDNAYRLVTATNANPDAVCEVTNYVDVRYPGELKLSGVQVSSVTGTYPSDGDWGDDYDSFADGTKKFTQASFTYITKRDENGRPGFVAADLVDERTLILENRNVVERDFSYRVQAE